MKKENKKRTSKIIEDFLVVIPFLLVLCILSRCLPDGTVRLNIGESGIGEKAIALTFDDGPSDYTEMLLDGLDEYNAKATFFVIGSKESAPCGEVATHEILHGLGTPFRSLCI